MKEMEDLTQSTEEASVLRWGYSLCLQPLPLLFLADPDFCSTRSSSLRKSPLTTVPHQQPGAVASCITHPGHTSIIPITHWVKEWSGLSPLQTES